MLSLSHLLKSALNWSFIRSYLIYPRTNDLHNFSRLVRPPCQHYLLHLKFNAAVIFQKRRLLPRTILSCHQRRLAFLAIQRFLPDNTAPLLVKLGKHRILEEKIMVQSLSCRYSLFRLFL